MPRLGLSLIGFILFVTIIGVAGAVIWNLREQAIANARNTAEGVSVLLAEQTTRSIQAVDLVLREVRATALSTVETADQFKRQMATEDVHNYLRDRLNSLQQADGVALVDDTGRIVNMSRVWPAPAIDASHSDFYQYWSTHNDANIFIGRPLRSKLTGAWEITLSRRITGRQGQFLGIALCVVELQYFERLYRAVAINKGESASLYRLDGLLLARYPDGGVTLGKEIASNSTWHQRVSAGGGTFRTAGQLFDEPRILSLRPVHKYPLVVSAGISEQAVLASWRLQSAVIVCALIGFAILLRALAAQFKKVEDSEARFRDFALTSSDWFWETDENHRFAFYSGGPRSRTVASGVLGRTRWEKAADAERNPNKWQEHRAVLNRHEPFRDFVQFWKNDDGAEGMASISGNPFFDSTGRFLGYRGTGRDITEKVRAERSLWEAKAAAEAASRAKSQFLANISHELRTPLNAILGFSEMLAAGLRGPLQPPQLEYVALIHQSGAHLHEVINDILDLAKIDAGKFELHEEQGLDLRRIINNCILLIKERAQEAELRLTVNIEDELPLLTADPTRLKQILLNLLSNAIKFTEAGGSVVIAVHRVADGGVVFEVRDTGLGMTAEQIEVALEPFGQVDSDMSRRHEGTGLGLPLACRLTELHGGSLCVESEEGRGTTVTVTLPAARVSIDTAVRAVEIELAATAA